MIVDENRARWLASPRVSAEDKATILAMDEHTTNDAFYKDVELGTGGLRGRLGPGTNRMNLHTVGRVATAFGQYVLSTDPNAAEKGIVIAHDNRYFSREFALLSADIFSKMGIKTYLFDSLRPTPELSYAVRLKGAQGGVMITASHNPKDYNGYKVYDETGCQLTPDKAEKMLALCDALPDELHFEVPSAKTKGEIITLDPSVDDSYCALVEACQRNPQMDKKGFKVVYTPQHGASYENAIRVFSDCGYEIIPVEEQCTHDPAFGGTKSPNPEVAAAWEKTIEKMKEVSADFAVMTDPDGDRCGVAYLSSKGTYERFTGNESAALLIDYLLSDMREKGDLPQNAVMYDTIVTSSLGRVIAESYGVKCESFLTGFKYIGSRIDYYEKKGNGPTFVFGYEESYGCLIRPFVRDKDGLQAILLYTEMALHYHHLGIPLDVAYDNLQKKYGYHLAVTKDTYFEGMEGNAKMKAMMEGLHRSSIKEIAGIRVVSSADYLNGILTREDGSEEKIEGLPPSDVMKYFLADGSTVCVRPSGTEPKVKFYIEAVGEKKEGLEGKVDALDADIRRITGAK
ncbi:MAG: phospho-sugar mutase [Candidatus Enteromonas sp.]|nr:phospho-sugar mutase [Candidatus Enteromonas sp.]